MNGSYPEFSIPELRNPWRDFIKQLAIEKIKRQPFFLPRVPHPYEGSQWVGIDMAQGGDYTAVYELNRIAPDMESTRMRAMLERRVLATDYTVHIRRRYGVMRPWHKK